MRSFIAEQIETEQVRASIKTGIKRESSPQGEGWYYDGVLELADFLSVDGRQFLEGQIFAYGGDLRQVCKTVRSRFCQDEITVPRAESQLPVIGDFSQEFDEFSSEIFDAELLRSQYQLRVYEPGYNGHPEHVDYAPGFTILSEDRGPVCLTSLSFSLPISWNDNYAPPFHLRHDGKEYVQDMPGSLTMFGPRVLHRHPSAPSLRMNYAWLIIQSFYKGYDS